MHFAFSEDQEELRRGARRFLDAHAAGGARALLDGKGDSQALWRRIADELGWPALIVPEAHGGAGLGLVELVAIQEEAGRALLASPFFATVGLGVQTLLACPAGAAWLPAIAAGELTATLAWKGRVTAVSRGGSFSLNGVLPDVLDGATADLVLVAAELDGRTALFAVPATTRGLRRTPLETLDPSRPQADLQLEHVELPADTLLAHPAEEALARALDRASIALAAEQLGGAQRCLEMAVDYGKTRVQFGRAIGSFQAIKHKCAEVFVAVESARSAVYWAACTAASGGDVAEAAAIARVAASEAFFKAAGENIQVHGGIGFTWEHDAHLHFRRARGGLSLFDNAASLAALADHVLGAG